MAGKGCFVWYELMTSDPEAAMDFYTKLIGWGTQELQDVGMPYTMWTAGETSIGGLMQLPEEAKAAGAPPHWLSYVSVDDVDAVMAQAAELGAKTLVAPQDIPTVGRFSVLADPQGAVIALFKPLESSDEESDSSALQRFSWHELTTTDYERGFEFYSALFGWQVLEDLDMGGGAIYRIYGREGAPPLGGMFTKPAEMPGPPAWLYYIKVDDVTQAIEEVTRLGGQVVNGPMEVPGGSLIAQCLDPQGAMFALHSTP